jgi:hypothetical protein
MAYSESNPVCYEVITIVAHELMVQTGRMHYHEAAKFKNQTDQDYIKIFFPAMHGYMIRGYLLLFREDSPHVRFVNAFGLLFVTKICNVLETYLLNTFYFSPFYKHLRDRSA